MRSLREALEPWAGDRLKMGGYFDFLMMAKASPEHVVIMSRTQMKDRWNESAGAVRYWLEQATERGVIRLLENLPEGAVYSVLGQPENYSLRAKKRNKKAYSDNFEKAWAHWPRAKADYNENKAKAWQVWQRQMGENGMSEEDLLRVIGRYIRWTQAEGMEVQYTKQLASFLSLQADHVSSEWRPRIKTVVSLSHSDIPPEDLQRELRGPE